MDEQSEGFGTFSAEDWDNKEKTRMTGLTG